MERLSSNLEMSLSIVKIASANMLYWCVYAKIGISGRKSNDKLLFSWMAYKRRLFELKIFSERSLSIRRIIALGWK